MAKGRDFVLFMAVPIPRTIRTYQTVTPTGRKVAVASHTLLLADTASPKGAQARTLTHTLTHALYTQHPHPHTGKPSRRADPAVSDFISGGTFMAGSFRGRSVRGGASRSSGSLTIETSALVPLRWCKGEKLRRGEGGGRRQWRYQCVYDFTIWGV